MQTAELQQQKAVYERQRQRFVSRRQFFSRCVDDIDNDFHKQYGQFESDWRAMHDACLVFESQIEEYLLNRDVGVIECNLILTAMEEATSDDELSSLKVVYQALMEEAQTCDEALLKEHDNNVAAVRSVYQMITHKEECGH